MMLRPASMSDVSSFSSFRPPVQTRADHSAVVPGSSTVNPGDESVDLRTEIARRVEEDPDYQILKKTFALESGKLASSSARHHDDRRGFSNEVVSSGDVAHVTDWGSTLAVSEVSTLDLEVTWTRASSSRLELSASVEGATVSARTGWLDERGLSIDLQFEASPAVQLGDPLVLDLGGGGFETTGVSDGVVFDLTASGESVQMSTVQGDSWLLALDRSGNGRIDDGAELFGDQHGAANGLEELAKHDSNADGRIDASDGVYDRLRLLQIRSDGSQVTQSLSEANVASIELSYQNTCKALNLYDQVAQTGSFTRSDGSQGEMGDLLLGYRQFA